MIVLKLFKLSIALLLLFAGLSATTMAQEAAQEEPAEASQSSEGPEERASRLEEYKQRAAERVSEARQARIENRCSAAQERIQTVLNTDRTRADARIEAHTKITTAVQRVSNALVDAGLDTSQIDAVATELQQKSDEVITALQAYLVTLEDITAMDCTADTEAFQSGLTLARGARTSLKELAATFRSYVTDDVRTALENVKSELTTSAEEEV